MDAPPGGERGGQVDRAGNASSPARSDSHDSGLDDGSSTFIDGESKAAKRTKIKFRILAWGLFGLLGLTAGSLIATSLIDFQDSIVELDVLTTSVQFRTTERTALPSGFFGLKSLTVSSLETWTGTPSPQKRRDKNFRFT